MKNKRVTLNSLKFSKTIIAQLDILQGGKAAGNDNSDSNSEHPDCPTRTLTTRPDSLDS